MLAPKMQTYFLGVEVWARIQGGQPLQAVLPRNKTILGGLPIKEDRELPPHAVELRDTKTGIVFDRFSTHPARPSPPSSYS
jgi:hypothetical protein